MRKILIISLCLPLFIFSQEEKKYERTMSISQFAQELKEAADKGINYTLENCYITYNPINDRKYVIENLDLEEFEGDALIRDLQFSDSSAISITNCKFGDVNKLPRGYQTTLQFFNCRFGSLNIKNINVGVIHLDSIYAKDIDLNCEKEKKDTKPYSIKVTNSEIVVLHATSYIESKQFGTFFFNEKPTLWIHKNTIRNTKVSGFKRLNFKENKAHALLIGGFYSDNHEMGQIWVDNNIFSGEINAERLSILKNDLWEIDNYNGIFINNLISNDLLWIRGNQIEKKQEIKSKDFDFLENKLLDIYIDRDISAKHCKDTLRLKDNIYDETWNITNKIDFLKKYFNNININIEVANSTSIIEIRNCEFESLWLEENSTSQLSISHNVFESLVQILRNDIDSVILVNSNTLPISKSVNVDSSFFNRIGIKKSYRDTTIHPKYWKKETLYGNEKYNDIKIYIKNDEQIFSSLIKFYKKWIPFLQNNGNPLANILAIKLKDIESNIKMYEYYNNPNIEKWFNWKGSVFLKWYSDYGTNPFKALAYCFWAMLYFAMFYFIFYNEWDKIDRGFLIKKFNSVMDYFTTEKRIEDFYSSTHDKEITTFKEFKETLDKNKVYMPGILASLAKPIYQISLLRYKLLNFSYKKAEFMAGRKWVDLEQKEKYWIGALTFFLTFTYIIYLVFIRALNSIVLSINAFSTLGFGQIPVRGFTKYVAIIEGFIGWFMLSIFLVSILNQMLSI